MTPTTSTELQTRIQKALENKSINPRAYEIPPKTIWQKIKKYAVINKSRPPHVLPHPIIHTAIVFHMEYKPQQLTLHFNTYFKRINYKYF